VEAARGERLAHAASAASVDKWVSMGAAAPRAKSEATELAEPGPAYANDDRWAGEDMPKGSKLRGWRKIAASTWRQPVDPQIYGDLEVDATAALSFIQECRARTGARVTMTHVVGKALAHAFAENPDLNGRVYRGRFVPRETVDIFFIVSAEQGQELTGVKVERVDEKAVWEVARELAERAGRIHSGNDEELGKTKDVFERFHPWVLRRLLRVGAWLSVDRDMDLKKQGLPRQAFGSAMISSVGMFGIQHAYAPLSPYYRVPLLVLVGEVQRKPVVVEGDRIEPRPMVNLAATLDHRYLDGFHAARLSRSVQPYMADPRRFEPPFGEAVDAPRAAEG
jgi:pyruvate/2-oxoglutarate dehydrogenase complex dihydrolipoamide acyltransferase (E2) component